MPCFVTSDSLLSHFDTLDRPARLDSSFACRLVHRLDKDASGCLVIARTADSAAWLSLAFAQHAKSVADAASIHTGESPCVNVTRSCTYWQAADVLSSAC